MELNTDTVDIAIRYIQFLDHNFAVMQAFIIL